MLGNSNTLSWPPPCGWQTMRMAPRSGRRSRCHEAALLHRIAVHALDRLESKGLIKTWMGGATAERVADAQSG